MAQKEELFPTIGSAAAQTDSQLEIQNDGDGEEKATQEIESLCMECREQVGIEIIRVSSVF